MKIVEEVIMDQDQADDPPTLAIPPKLNLAFYEAKLSWCHHLEWRPPVGLMNTTGVSKETALTVYRAHPMPMPQPESTISMRWKTATPFLDISENNLETALLTQYASTSALAQQLTRFDIDQMPQSGHGSCHATLLQSSTKIPKKLWNNSRSYQSQISQKT